jgi:hypothetical protein
MGFTLDEIWRGSEPARTLAVLTTETVTYQGTVISAIVLRETRHRDEDPGSITLEHDVMDIVVALADVPTPQEYGFKGQAGDTVIIGADTWYVARVLERDAGGLHRLRLSDKKLVRGRN